MLTNIEKMAVSKALKESQIKEAREELQAGSYPVNMTVRIHGMIDVGKDTERVSTSSLISEDFMLLVLKKAGFMRDQAATIIKEVATECLKDWKGTKEDKEKAKDARAAMVAEFDPDGKIRNMLNEIKKSIPKTPVRGSVSFDGQVEVLEQSKMAALELVG